MCSAACETCEAQTISERERCASSTCESLLVSYTTLAIAPLGVFGAGVSAIASLSVALSLSLSLSLSLDAK